MRFGKVLPTTACPLAQVLLGYIEAGERGEPVHPDINREPIEDSTDRLYQSLMPLSTAYVVAPLLGVLGTTIAIMGTFRQFAIAGDRDMVALVLAIDQSLVSTMWGLVRRRAGLLLLRSAAEAHLSLRARRVAGAQQRDLQARSLYPVPGRGSARQRSGQTAARTVRAG